MHRLVSLVLLAIAFVLRPERARCPDGRDLRTGIRRDGHFACWSRPIGDPEWDGTFGRPDRSVQRDDAVEGRIWCGAGAVPVVVDERTVACEGARR